MDVMSIMRTMGRGGGGCSIEICSLFGRADALEACTSPLTMSFEIRSYFKKGP